MNQVKRILNINKYVGKMLYEDGVKIGIFIKGAPVNAYQVDKVTEGKTVLADGTVERQYWKAEVGDWIATGVGKEMWPITAKVFNGLYDIPNKVDTKKPAIYVPKPIARFCVQTKEDISFPDPWEEGKQFVLKAGGYLNINNLDKIYGIGKDEFEKTHSVASEKIIRDNVATKQELGQALVNLVKPTAGGKIC